MPVVAAALVFAGEKLAGAVEFASGGEDVVVAADAQQHLVSRLRHRRSAASHLSLAPPLLFFVSPASDLFPGPSGCGSNRVPSLAKKISKPGLPPNPDRTRPGWAQPNGALVVLIIETTSGLSSTL